MTGQRGKRCKGSNSNRVANKVAKELGVEEEAGDDQKKRSVEIEGLPVQVIGNILSRFDDVKDVTDIRFTAESPILAQRFLCLLSLKLHSVEASALQLQSFVASCKSLESLSLDCMRFRDTELTVNLTSSSLKSFSLKGMSLDSRHGNVVLEASSLESIRLLESSFRSLKLVKKGARVRSVRIARFRSLTIDNVQNSVFGPWKQQHRLSSVRRGRTEELRPLCLHCNRRCSFKTILDIEEVTIVGHPTLC
ncbi:unnamed protein product [Sphagnum compactum]